ncbi:MAG: ATPase [Oligoflexia bacterium]|nr:MAG: ATPase [Oligoflexia bacterium]
MSIAHERKRHCVNLLRKKLKFSPIVSIQGPRQCGKSYLAQNIVPQFEKHSEYKNLDLKENRDFAQKNPNTFLSIHSGKPLIIDEVQKVPDLFDEMKGIVDEKRTPGRFLILGSTEFSHETKIRESLTGRLSRIRMFPLGIAETKKFEMNEVSQFPFLQKKVRINRADLFKYLERGGFPGIFIVKNDQERRSLFEDWVRLTCERDIHQINKFKLDSALSYEILAQLATLPEPNVANLAKELRVTTRKIQNHILALKMLFVIFEVAPLAGSAGKPLYYLCDPGLLTFFEASLERKMLTWFYTELIMQLSYKEQLPLQIQYYKSKTSSPVHFIIEQKKKLLAAKMTLSESYDKRDFAIFQSFQKKYSQKYESIECYGFYGGKTQIRLPDYVLSPWEQIV